MTDQARRPQSRPSGQGGRQDHDRHSQRQVKLLQFLSHEPLRLGGAKGAGAGADRGEGERLEAVRLSQPGGIADRIPNRAFRSPPEQVDPGDVDDSAKRKLTSGSEYGSPEGNWSPSGKFLKRVGPGSPLDGSGTPLRQQQPQRMMWRFQELTIAGTG